MVRLGPARALFGLGVLLLADGASATQTNEYQCNRAGLVRRVQLGGGPGGQPLPCEVVYWKDSEHPGSGQILWNAATDQQYCEDKAKAFVDKLRGRGWQCERFGERLGEGSGALLDHTAERRMATVWPRIKPSPGATRRHAAGRAVAPGDGVALGAVIDDTIASLAQLHSGVFAGEVADHGDLDGDGVEDAVVIITYRADGGQAVQYLVAYLFDGEGYRSAAARNLGGWFDTPYRGKVEQIVDGEIQVKLQVGEEPARASQPAAFVLQEGRLVRLE
jgi:hypothetical protein